MNKSKKILSTVEFIKNISETGKNLKSKSSEKKEVKKGKKEIKKIKNKTKLRTLWVRRRKKLN